MVRSRPARAAALAVVIAWPHAVLAEVKEYQIRRMLMLQTECTVSGLEISMEDGRDRFSARCENVSHYPDGVEIVCPDSEDERDCTILTRKRTFPFLPVPRP